MCLSSIKYLRVFIFNIFCKFCMDNIIEPDENFDFSKITLAHPTSIQSGAYFTKIECNKRPLYIQTSKSLTRQGFVKSGKKYYCDLMFDKHAEMLIQWFEKLEERCKQLIYEKREDWFQGGLEESDIENAFNPLMRIYKSGKYYLLRTNIKNTKEDIPAVKIYNENEITMTMSDITTETELVSILEIQGIKFTTRNFQIEIELKQVMIMDNERIFESCLIKSNKRISAKPLDKQEPSFTLEDSGTATVAAITEPIATENVTEKEALANDNQSLGMTMPTQKVDVEKVDVEILEKDTPLEKEMDDFLEDLCKDKETPDIDIEFEDLNEVEEKDDDVDLREIAQTELNLDKTTDTITLKKPNQVYFELYKEAREKAKQAKKNAIIAYLEAKNIKKTYMIENMNDSESDIDAEIDDVSESELEYL